MKNKEKNDDDEDKQQGCIEINGLKTNSVWEQWACDVSEDNKNASLMCSLRMPIILNQLFCFVVCAYRFCSPIMFSAVFHFE